MQSILERNDLDELMAMVRTWASMGVSWTSMGGGWALQMQATTHAYNLCHSLCIYTLQLPPKPMLSSV
jgi:hypothetical protein